MIKIAKKFIKYFSNKNIDVKKNYKLFRKVQRVINPVIGKRKVYEDTYFHIGDRSIKIRVFNGKNSKEKNKVIFFIHGGGWVTGSVDTYTNMCIELSKMTNRVILAIDYRLADEAAFPAGFDDCYEVIRLFMDNLQILKTKNQDVCLMGDSAGGNLAAAVSLKARDTKDFKIDKQILIYPILQTDFSENSKYKSVLDNGNDYLLTRKQLCSYIDMYIKDKKDLTNPYVSPLKAKQLFLQPKTLIITADLDPLRDEGKTYAKRLKSYFNRVEYHNLKGAIHGFLSQPLERKYTLSTYKKIKEFLGDDNEI